MAAKALGIKVASPAFSGVDVETIQSLLKEAQLPDDGKQQLYDGRNGMAFTERTTVGSMYMIKLNHMIADKIHARSTGPYTMVTNNHLVVKPKTGGQRFGEMEVWALEAYGAANTLQEMLTIKSDDVYGRSKAYESIIKRTELLDLKYQKASTYWLKSSKVLALKFDLVSSDKVVDAEAVLANNIKDEASHQPTIDVPEPSVSDVDLTEEATVDEFADLSMSISETIDEMSEPSTAESINITEEA